MLYQGTRRHRIKKEIIMVSQGRALRIAQRIMEELSEIMLFEVTDPRLQEVYITNVRVDRELAFASIFFSAIGDDINKDDILASFENASGFLRRSLSHRIQLRFFPKLRFNWDPSPEHVERIDELIASLKENTDGENKDSE